MTATAGRHSYNSKNGELRRYLGIFEGWQMGYFRLERCYFHYFRHKEAMAPAESLTRGEITLAYASTLGRFPSMVNVFKIQTKSGKTWTLQAKSAEEMNEWISLITPSKHSILTTQQASPSILQPTELLSARRNNEEMSHSWSTANLSTPNYNNNQSQPVVQTTENYTPRTARTVSPPPPYSEHDPAGSSLSYHEITGSNQSDIQPRSYQSNTGRTNNCIVS